MAGLENVTFDVRYLQGSKAKIKTTITIFDKHIQCPKTPNIKYDALDQIIINNAEKEKYRERSFGLRYKAKVTFVFHFVAKNKAKRDEILLEILTRFPSNKTNQSHWKTIQSATLERVLKIDHNEPQSEVTTAAESIAESEMTTATESEVGGYDEDDDLLIITKSASENPSENPSVSPNPDALRDSQFMLQRQMTQNAQFTLKKGRQSKNVKTVLDTAKLRQERRSMALENERLKEKNKKLKALHSQLARNPTHQDMKAQIQRLTEEKRQSTRQSMTLQNEVEAARIALNDAQKTIKKLKAKSLKIEKQYISRHETWSAKEATLDAALSDLEDQKLKFKQEVQLKNEKMERELDQMAKEREKYMRLQHDAQREKEQIASKLVEIKVDSNEVNTERKQLEKEHFKMVHENNRVRKELDDQRHELRKTQSKLDSDFAELDASRLELQRQREERLTTDTREREKLELEIQRVKQLESDVKRERAVMAQLESKMIMENQQNLEKLRNLQNQLQQESEQLLREKEEFLRNKAAMDSQREHLVDAAAKLDFDRLELERHKKEAAEQIAKMDVKQDQFQIELLRKQRDLERDKEAVQKQLNQQTGTNNEIQTVLQKLKEAQKLEELQKDLRRESLTQRDLKGKEMEEKYQKLMEDVQREKEKIKREKAGNQLQHELLMNSAAKIEFERFELERQREEYTENVAKLEAERAQIERNKADIERQKEEYFERQRQKMEMEREQLERNKEINTRTRDEIASDFRKLEAERKKLQMEQDRSSEKQANTLKLQMEREKIRKDAEELDSLCVQFELVRDEYERKKSAMESERQQITDAVAQLHSERLAFERQKEAERNESPKTQTQTRKKEETLTKTEAQRDQMSAERKQPIADLDEAAGNVIEAHFKELMAARKECTEARKQRIEKQKE